MITVLAHGSRGDVQPFIALAYGLRQAGYTVRLVANADFDGLARQYNLEFASLPATVQTLLETESGQAMLQSGSLLRALQYFWRETSRYNTQVQEASWDACLGAETLVYSVLSLWGYDVAEKLGIRGMPVFLIPAYPTRNFPCPQGTIPNLGGLCNRWSHQALFGLVWQMMYRAPVARLRREKLNLKGLPGIGERLLAPQLHAYSPTVVPRPADWPERVRVTGYWFLPAPEGWQPSPALVDFLAAGDAPVYVGFGSMVNRDAQGMTRLVVEAIQQSGVRAVLARGWGGLDAEALPGGVFLLDSAPHDWLFPRMAAVVHHGGAGTTGAGLAAGVPSILVPHMQDQFFWGQRVLALGVGPRPLPRQHLTAERLAEAIHVATSDPQMQARARHIGALIRAEDGIRKAMALVT